MSVPSVAQDVFPQDEQWGLDARGYSPEMARRMVWLSAGLPYEQWQAVFERIGECWLGRRSIWRQTQKHAERLQRYVQHQRQQVSVERISLPAARHDHDQGKASSMDGGMVNIRHEGWRELKAGAVFEVAMRLERSPQSGAWAAMADALNTDYTAVLGTNDDFAAALWALAVEYDLPTARERAVVADGALWIWMVAEEVCPDGRRIVDWFHAVAHLAQAASALSADASQAKQRQQWLKTYRDPLYMGRILKMLGVPGASRACDVF